jgi:large subunit ribosomal protein L10
MGMTRAQKSEEVKELQDLFASNDIVVLTHYSGMTVKEISDLRAKLRAEGGRFKVTKNSLAKLALKGTPFEAAADMFKGPTGVAVSKDPVAAARVAHNFAKTNDKLIILGGSLGAEVLNAESVKMLATLPSLDELRSKIIGLLQAPATKLARVLQAPAQALVGVTKAYGEKA